MRHAGGKNGQKSMKAVTIVLLSMIREGANGLTPKQLEAKFPIGLKKEIDDPETGQEWLRYSHPPSDDRKENQALSVDKLYEIAEQAVELGYLTQEDLWQIQLIDLSQSQAVQERIANERIAHQLFHKGKTRLLAGKMPLAPGLERGGRPRAPRSENEAADCYRTWIKKIESLGGAVFEDRQGLIELDDWLIEFLGIQWAPRDLANEDYELLPPWARPLDPARPDIDALRRLRIRFSFGWLDKPWSLDYKPTNRAKVGLAALSTDEVNIEELFQTLEGMLSHANS